MEEEGKVFYERLAANARNANVKDICLGLARKELEHKQIIESMLHRWLPLPLDTRTAELLKSEIETNGIFMNAPLADAGEKAMVKYAVDQENRMASFYQSFEKAFPGAWKQMHLGELVMEERSHASQLIATYPDYF